MVKKILKIRALTSLHPGSGTGIGVIDMPVQRERHTGFPIIPGSSIKGVLRTVSPINEKLKNTIFGPENGTDGKYASSASFSDARIFAYPVRSLKGIFAWVTCPEVIRRVNFELGKDFIIPQLNDGEIICGQEIVAVGNSVVLEEYDFNKKTETINTEILKFGKEFFSNDNDKTSFEKRFAIISDNDFAHFARYATEVNARIALDHEKGTKNAKKGALFYEEFLPPETLFYSTIIFEDARDGSNIKADELSKKLELPNVAQFGGDETIGKGICEINLN